MNNRFLKARAKTILQQIHSYLEKHSAILDIGAGSGHISKLLKDRGFKVTALDIKNQSYFSDINLIIYDGKKLPFKDNSFNISLLITVLHHTKNPEALLKEAARVSRKIIIMEDIYKGSIQKYLTFIMDSIINLEFLQHPHSNKTDKEWKETFKKLNLELKSVKYYQFWKFFSGAIYYLAKIHP